VLPLLFLFSVVYYCWSREKSLAVREGAYNFQLDECETWRVKDCATPRRGTRGSSRLGQVRIAFSRRSGQVWRSCQYIRKLSEGWRQRSVLSEDDFVGEEESFLDRLSINGV